MDSNELREFVAKLRDASSDNKARIGIYNIVLGGDEEFYELRATKTGLYTLAADLLEASLADDRLRALGEDYAPDSEVRIVEIVPLAEQSQVTGNVAVEARNVMWKTHQLELQRLKKWAFIAFGVLMVYAWLEGLTMMIRRAFF